MAVTNEPQNNYLFEYVPTFKAYKLTIIFFVIDHIYDQPTFPTEQDKVYEELDNNVNSVQFTPMSQNICYSVTPAGGASTSLSNSLIECPAYNVQ